MGGLAKTGMAMKLYLAETNMQHQGWGQREVKGNGMQLRILLSYHYYKNADLDALFAKYFTKPYPEVFADSGGFSAFTQGAKIDLNAYAGWIKRWSHLFTTYANLDVIGSVEGTLKNQHRLERLGLSPLPVFHVGEDWSYLERYINDYPYIALGGMVPHMRFHKRLMPWLVQAFKKAEGKSVFHGFGATSWPIVTALPWYSVDSSSWGQGFRFGEVPLFDEKKGRFFKVRLGNPKSCYRYGRLIRSLGFDPGEFANRERNDRARICAVSALSYMKTEQWLRKRHGEIHIPSRDGASSGLRFYLADARGDLSSADAGLKIHLAEHTFDRGGVGDTSRAMEVINEDCNDT